jgi:hypothetical protein
MRFAAVTRVCEALEEGTMVDGEDWNGPRWLG